MVTSNFNHVKTVYFHQIYIRKIEYISEKHSKQIFEANSNNNILAAT